MKNEIKDLNYQNEIKDLNYQSSLIKQSRNSYITKENFIEIISKLEFDRIETANIHFITSYEYIPEDGNKREHVRTFGYDLNIS